MELFPGHLQPGRRIGSIVLLILLSGHTSFSQKKDSIRKFLNADIGLTKQANSIYQALVTREADHWRLYSAYPDTNPLLEIDFADKSLTTRDGLYTLYHPHG